MEHRLKTPPPKKRTLKEKLQHIEPLITRKPHTEETKAKMSAAQKGKKKTSIHKRKIAESLSGIERRAAGRRKFLQKKILLKKKINRKSSL